MKSSTAIRLRPAALGLLLATGLAAGVSAQTGKFNQARAHNTGQTGRAAIFSADRRFMVSGMTSAENMVLVGQLSGLAAKVEVQTGMILPMQRDQVLGVMVHSSSTPDAQVLKMQGWDDGRFYQRLVVPSVIRMDAEDLMEGACWLLLNRHAVEYTPPGQRTGMGATVLTGFPAVWPRTPRRA